MEAILERISVQQFVATLKPAEVACVVALGLGYQQNEIAEIFGDSPSTICRLIQGIQSKYALWIK